MLAWANLHGSFVFGFLLLGGFALEALIDSPADRRWPTARDWALVCALSLAAAALTPQGVMGLAFPFKLLNQVSLAGVDEWRGDGLLASPARSRSPSWPPCSSPSRAGSRSRRCAC